MKKIKESFLWIVFLCLVTGLILYKVVFVTNMSWPPSFWTFYGIIVTFFLVSRIPYAYLHKDEHRKIYQEKEYPDVSIVVAAKNEKEGIFETIRACIDSKYPAKLECIVIDDGSTDGTKEEVIRAQNIYGDRVKIIIFPENRGKREAMAAGVRKALYEIIVFVDSDSFLSPDAIRHITEHFIDDKKLGAASGNTKVKNEDATLLTKMQAIQYAISFDVYKASESVHSAVTCCPGCFSAYRKVAIEPLLNDWKSHKFMKTKSTFGDDRGLTNFVLQNWDIVYCEKAQATTIVPEKFKKYWNQQLRWKKSWIREGVFASTFMWKKHILAGLSFYINFSFPILGPILALTVLVKSIETNNPLLFLIFMTGFLLLGFVFALFVRVYFGVKKWIYMPLFSLLFVAIFLWQMPYALLTLNKTHWGSR